MDKIKEFLKRLKRPKKSLRSSMLWIIILCWLIPVTVLTSAILNLLSQRINNQIENTIVTATDKAIDLCQYQIDDIIRSSKNASYLPNIKEGYVNYQKDGDKQKLHSVVTNFMNQQYKYKPNLMLAVLYFVDEESDLYFTYSNSKVNYAMIKEFKEQNMEAIVKKAEDLGTGICLYPINGHLYLIRNLVTSSFEPYAVSILEVNTETVFSPLESIWGMEKYQIYMDGIQLVGEDDEWDLDYSTTADAMEKSVYMHSPWQSFVYKIIKENRHKYCYRIQLDTKAILDETSIIGYLTSAIIVFMVPIFIMIYVFFYHKVTRPIQLLVDTTEEIARGHYGITIKEESNSSEFEYLFENYDRMSLKLKEQFEKIYLEELALKDARIMALQSQINPHFLNNTLEIINWESRMSGNEKVSGMIEALSTMLNATMNRKSENMITLEEELSYVDAYLYIISQRFGKRFAVEKEIDETLINVMIPRLIIQPIIENAVEHGVDRKEKVAKVKISIWSEDNKLYIEVLNNGHMSDKDRKKVEELLGDWEDKERREHTSSTSLGIRNVDRRIKIIYGNECGLTITSRGEYETVSTIIVKIGNNHNKSQ